MEKNKKTKKEKTNFTGKAGTSIKIITETIKKETKRKAISVTHNRKINKDKIKSGKIMTSDMDAIRVGMKILNKIMQNSLNRVEMDLKLGKGEDINQKQKYIYEYRKIINSFINSISRNIEEEMAIQADIDYVEECTDIVQAARDGILLKQEERTEMIDGEEKKLVYDTTITEKEVLSVLDKYQRIKNDVKLQKLENYLGIGLSAAGIIGTMVRDKNNSLKMNSEKIMTLSFIAVKSIKLLGDMTNKNIIGKKKENLKEISDQRRKIKSETLENEHISSKDKERTIENYKFLRKKEQKAEKGIDI